MCREKVLLCFSPETRNLKRETPFRLLSPVRIIPRIMFLRMTQSEIIFAVQESPEGGYEAHALGHPIFTQADSLEELKTMLRDAVACHFAESEKPSVIRLHMVKDEVIPV